MLHDANAKNGLRYLADAAALARGLARLADVSGEKGYAERAVTIARAMRRQLTDERDAKEGANGPNGRDVKDGMMWGATVDPSAAGVFAKRTHPFAPNILAARALAAIAASAAIAGLTPGSDDAWRDHAARLLASTLTPRGLEAQGRWLGETLLALDEAGALTW